MENRYQQTFSRLKEEKTAAFVPYTMLGYPNRENCLESIKAMIENGASALELGLAFSDPLADGPVIQAAAAETLASGFKTRDAFDLIKEVRKLDRQIPITLMCYYNCVLARSSERFCKEASEAGVDGLLVVDLPAQESGEFYKHCKSFGLSQIFIVSPLTTKERLALIAEKASGFIYLVSRLGVTGIEERYDDNLSAVLKQTSAITKLPVLVGFGISNPEQASKMCSLGADGVITGSKIIELLKAQNEGTKTADDFAQYLRAMSSSTRQALLSSVESC